MKMIRDKHAGAKSELIACAWLLSCGYDVFRNVSPHGASDVVAIKGDELLKIDIKSNSHRHAPPRLKQSQINEGIKALYVKPDGSCFLDMNPEVMFHFPYPYARDMI
jgi:hypothetical protein